METIGFAGFKEALGLPGDFDLLKNKEELLKTLRANGFSEIKIV